MRLASAALLLTAALTAMGCGPAYSVRGIKRLNVGGGGHRETFTDPETIAEILDATGCWMPFMRRAAERTDGELNLGLLSYGEGEITAQIGTYWEGEVVFIPGRWVHEGGRWRFVTEAEVLQPTVDRFIERAAGATGAPYLTTTTLPAGRPDTQPSERETIRQAD